MKETLIVSNRGQITLPSAFRKRTGIKEGSALIIEERGGELVLMPAAVFKIEMYSDRQIAEWDSADRLLATEKKAILKKVKKKK